MLILFVILTGLSVVALVAGTAWTLLQQGETRRRSGPEVGAEIVAEQMDDEDEEGAVVVQRTAFKGKAVQVEREASISLADVKQQIRAGQWRENLPVLLIVGGFAGLLLFGALTAWVAVDDKLVGGLVAVVAIYALVRMVLAFVRA
jgi:hypothetical protein